jgi:uncharacterized protein
LKIAILGGTGQIGTLLARTFHKDAHEVTVFGRSVSSAAARKPWQMVRLDPSDIPAMRNKVDGADVVINLVGRSVNCRYTANNKREILESRVQSVRALGTAIAQALHPPRVWLQISTATIYAHTYGPPNDEFMGVIGGSEDDAPESWRFSIEVASAWEAAVDEFSLPATRKLKLRSAVVLSPDRGGIFDTLLGLVRKGLGGKSGNGKQYVSWIHDADFVRSIYFLIERQDISDIVNLASPNPIPNSQFMAELRKAWGIRFGMPSPVWMLEIGAIFMQTESELILKSRRVVPGKLLREGFVFEYPDWKIAARDLCARSKAEGR